MSCLLAFTCSGYPFLKCKKQCLNHFIDLFNTLYQILTIYFLDEVGALTEQFDDRVGRLEATKGPATTESIGGNVHGCVAVVIA